MARKMTLSVYVCVHVCHACMLMCACVLVHVFVCMFMRVCMCACMPCMYAYVCMCACACVCMYVYTCMYVCVYARHVCVCVHVCLCKCLYPNSGSYRDLVVFNAKPQQLFKSPVQSPSILPFKIPLEFLESSF